MNKARFEQAIARIDAANVQDPAGLEVAHSERRTAWIRQLVGDEASEALLLAARAQHLRRWEIPRDTYPRDRAGYLQWRQELKQFHAEKTAEILQAVGYEAAMSERVRELILKKRLKLDPEVQALEDALCLVFLEEQFSDFAQKEADKIVDIVAKTWRKMSLQGQQFALTLPLTPEDRAIIEQALATLPG
jgi:hypothetical protein